MERVKSTLWAWSVKYNVWCLDNKDTSWFRLKNSIILIKYKDFYHVVEKKLEIEDNFAKKMK